MHSSYNSKAIEDCLDCRLCADRLFSGLPLEVLRAFSAIKNTTLCPRGVALFVEGQTPHGIFVLCTGRAKLSIGSRDGRTLITRIAGPGEFLGLSAAISGKPYEVTVETLAACQVDVVRREDFLQFLREHQEAHWRIAHHLSDDYHAAHDQVRSLGLSNSATERLAKLLLGWCAQGKEETEQEIRLPLLLTHEEIAQMIGSSRETVTRLLSSFRSQQIVHMKGSTLLIRDKAALEALVSS
jgi:CRP/FNR family cyclic AMP-dependent transcriptional regulator